MSTVPRSARRASARRPSRTALAATLVTCSACAAAAPASADVLVRAVPDGRTTTTTRYAPDGTTVALAPSADGASDVAVDPAISPDGSTLAIPDGGAIQLVPTAGGPSRTVGDRDLPTPFVPPEVRAWWNADGSQVALGSVMPRPGRFGIAACTVPTGACVVHPGAGAAARTGVIGSTVDGRAVLAGRLPDALDRRIVGSFRPRRATAATVRRLRSTLRRRFSDTLALTGPTGGGPVRTWRRTTTLARGDDQLTTSAPGPTGTLVIATRFRYAVKSTRGDRGRREVALDLRVASERVWRITPEGERRTVLPGSRTRDRMVGEPAPTADGRWLVRMRGTAERPTTGPELRILDGAGRMAPLLVQGRAPTAEGLHRALGLPDPDDAPQPNLSLVGVERAAGNAVLSYELENGREVVVRTPLAGSGPPSLVTQTPAGVSGQVSAW